MTASFTEFLRVTLGLIGAFLTCGSSSAGKSFLPVIVSAQAFDSFLFTEFSTEVSTDFVMVGIGHCSITLGMTARHVSSILVSTETFNSLSRFQSQPWCWLTLSHCLPHYWQSWFCSGCFFIRSRQLTHAHITSGLHKIPVISVFFNLEQAEQNQFPHNKHANSPFDLLATKSTLHPWQAVSSLTAKFSTPTCWLWLFWSSRSPRPPPCLLLATMASSLKCFDSGLNLTAMADFVSRHRFHGEYSQYHQLWDDQWLVWCINL